MVFFCLLFIFMPFCQFLSMDRADMQLYAAGEGGNIFIPELEWLQRLIARPHGLGLEKCYKEIGAKFISSPLPVNQKLNMLRAIGPAVHEANACHGTRSSYHAALDVIGVVDNAADADYSLANQVLDMLEPDRSLKRYPTEQ